MSVSFVAFFQGKGNLPSHQTCTTAAGAVKLTLPWEVRQWALPHAVDTKVDCDYKIRIHRHTPDGSR